MAAGHKRDSNGNIVDNDAPSTAVSQQQPNTANSSKPTRRFECTFEGCSKSYTRAEHLGRHQLNHNPKDIYKCDFPGCTRTFVRQDLCARHRERHDAPPSKAAETLSSDEDDGDGTTRRVGRPRLSSLNRNAKLYEIQTSTTSASALQTPGLDQSTNSETNHAPPVTTQATTAGNSNVDQAPSEYPPQASLTGSINGFSIDMLNSQPPTGAQPDGYSRHFGSGSNDYPLPTLPEFHESPASVRDEFTAWLFDEHFSNPAAVPFFNAPMNTFGMLGNDFMPFGSTPMFTDFRHDTLPQDISLEITTPRSDGEVVSTEEVPWISPSKRLKLVELLQGRFVDAENKDIISLGQEIFNDDIDGEDHVLSLRSMQQYLGSYWKHFHQQLPILHQPTFSADAANDLLVLAIMAIGASQLGSRHSKMKTTAASRLATFVAWHLRWQIFMHVDFRPPAKLWVFQTLLLLEIYEKLASTRQMHERAHVHSATMINLMRRGTTLIGDDETARRTPGPTTPAEAWQRWIETESTRRAAFAAFIIDATHAEMFGHAAIMVVHELRLPLPCDDALWSATTAAEVGRVHASLHTHGIKPTTFLDGLKRTLTGKKVKTNSFGRTILMAGLLSITWHLNQRDLQVSSLGASSSLGMPGIWREALAKSFDFWKRDFDESMSHMKNVSLPWQQIISSEDRDVCSAAGVLHHLSHIALHVDVLDCQIFIGAQKLFGRVISQVDRDRAKHKMLEWVKTPAARSATFHALQLVKPIVMQASSSLDFYNCRADYLLERAWVIYYSLLVLWSFGYALDGVLRPFPSQLPTHQTYLSPDLSWSGQVQTPISESQFQDQLHDARTYFNAIGNATGPDDLRMLQCGRNRLVGLLGLFASSFRDSRWELLQEGATRLEGAIRILKDGN